MRRIGLCLLMLFFATQSNATQVVQQFQYGLVDWDRGLALVEGSAPLDQGGPSSRLRSQRAARVSLFMNVFRLSAEMTGVDMPEKMDTGEDLFKEVVVTGGERDGYYVLWAWFPIERVKGLLVSP